MLDSNLTELYPYYLAMHLKKKHFCKILRRVLLRKVIFFHSFFSPNNAELKSLNVSFDLLFVLLIVLFNTFCYLNYFIHNQFVNEGFITWYVSCSNSMVALFCSWIILKLLRKAFSFQKHFRRILIDIKDYDMICEYAKILMEKLKRTVVMFYIVNFLVFGFCWYYVTTFSIIYNQTHNKLIQNVIVSCLVYILFYNAFAFLIALCKWLGICYKSNTLYNFGLWLYSVI